jgi:hypothetical protein
MSRPPMHPLLKLLITAAVIIGIYSGIMILMPYIRFADIKSKTQEAVQNAMAETDESLAGKLAETALDDKLPIAGDYFYQVRDAQGKVAVLMPETEAQQKEYDALATAYFLKSFKRNADRSLSIVIDYTQEVYFPFNVYKHTIHFHHEEGQQPNR